MRIEFTRDVGKTVRLGEVQDLADDVARLLIGQGLAREVAVPGVGPVPATDILVPDEPPEAEGLRRLRQKEQGG